MASGDRPDGGDDRAGARRRDAHHRSVPDAFRKIESRRRERAESQLRAILGARLLRQIEARVPAMEMGKLVDRIVARTIDPYSAVDEMLGDTEPRAGRPPGEARSGARGPRDTS